MPLNGSLQSYAFPSSILIALCPGTKIAIVCIWRRILGTKRGKERAQKLHRAQKSTWKAEWRKDWRKVKQDMWEVLAKKKGSSLTFLFESLLDLYDKYSQRKPQTIYKNSFRFYIILSLPSNQINDDIYMTFDFDWIWNGSLFTTLVNHYQGRPPLR